MERKKFNILVFLVFLASLGSHLICTKGNSEEWNQLLDKKNLFGELGTKVLKKWASDYQKILGNKKQGTKNPWIKHSLTAGITENHEEIFFLARKFNYDHSKEEGSVLVDLLTKMKYKPDSKSPLPKTALTNEALLKKTIQNKVKNNNGVYSIFNPFLYNYFLSYAAHYDTMNPCAEGSPLKKYFCDKGMMGYEKKVREAFENLVSVYPWLEKKNPHEQRFVPMLYGTDCETATKISAGGFFGTRKDVIETLGAGMYFHLEGSKSDHYVGQKECVIVTLVNTLVNIGSVAESQDKQPLGTSTTGYFSLVKKGSTKYEPCSDDKDDVCKLEKAIPVFNIGHVGFPSQVALPLWIIHQKGNNPPLKEETKLKIEKKTISHLQPKLSIPTSPQFLRNKLDVFGELLIELGDSKLEKNDPFLKKVWKKKGSDENSGKDVVLKNAWDVIKEAILSRQNCIEENLFDETSFVFSPRLFKVFSSYLLLMNNFPYYSAYGLGVLKEREQKNLAHKYILKSKDNFMNSFLKKWKFAGEKFKKIDGIKTVNEEGDVLVLPLLHSADCNNAQSIIKNGFISTAALDAGWFGKGVYFSDSLKYVTQYTKPYSPRFCFVLSLVVLGSAMHHNWNMARAGDAVSPGFTSEYAMLTFGGYVFDKLNEVTMENAFHEYALLHNGGITPAALPIMLWEIEKKEKMSNIIEKVKKEVEEWRKKTVTTHSERLPELFFKGGINVNFKITVGSEGPKYLSVSNGKLIVTKVQTKAIDFGVVIDMQKKEDEKAEKSKKHFGVISNRVYIKTNSGKYMSVKEKVAEGGFEEVVLEEGKGKKEGYHQSFTIKVGKEGSFSLCQTVDKKKEDKPLLYCLIVTKEDKLKWIRSDNINEKRIEECRFNLIEAPFISPYIVTPKPGSDTNPNLHLFTSVIEDNKIKVNKEAMNVKGTKLKKKYLHFVDAKEKVMELSDVDPKSPSFNIVIEAADCLQKQFTLAEKNPKINEKEKKIQLGSSRTKGKNKQKKKEKGTYTKGSIQKDSTKRCVRIKSNSGKYLKLENSKEEKLLWNGSGEDPKEVFELRVIQKRDDSDKGNDLVEFSPVLKPKFVIGFEKDKNGKLNVKLIDAYSSKDLHYSNSVWEIQRQ